MRNSCSCCGVPEGFHIVPVKSAIFDANVGIQLCYGCLLAIAQVALQDIDEESEFCRNCTYNLLSEDPPLLNDYVPGRFWCTGCAGFTVVDANGFCVSTSCRIHGEENA